MTSEKTYRSDLVQITLKRVAETVKIQIIKIVVERILAAAVINIGGDGQINMNTYISCPISKNPSNRNAVKAVAL